ncbi:MAG: sensor histidine kinase [Bacteroidales bacterium]
MKKKKNESRILSLENQNLQKDLELRNESNRKNMYLAGIGVFVLITFFSIVYFKLRIRKNKLIAEEEKKLISAQALLEGQENEQQRISKELHDGVGVMLSTANLFSSSIKRLDSDDRELLEKAQDLVKNASIDVHNIARNLMPTALNLYGLTDALAELFDNVDKLPGIYADFFITGEPINLPKSKETMIYRLVQELVNNTMKHAKAKSIDMTLDYGDDSLIITYKDDGVGFDFEKELSKKSIGLKSIQSRIDYLKGKLEFQPLNEVDSAYRFLITIPVKDYVIAK